MTLQTKVTFGSVLLATVVVTAVSGVNLGSFMDLELEATLERADVIKGVATGEVTDTLNRRRDVVLREALRDPELKRKLLNLLRSPNGVLSIDMVSADSHEVLASTLDTRAVLAVEDDGLIPRIPVIQVLAPIHPDRIRC